MTTPWLTDEEIDDRCAGLVQNAAKVRYLQSLGLTVKTKPNGRPVVERAHYEQVMAGLSEAERKKRPTKTPAARAPAQPNLGGLVVAFARK